MHAYSEYCIRFEIPDIGSTDTSEKMPCLCQIYKCRHVTDMPKTISDMPHGVSDKINKKMPCHCRVQASYMLCLKK